MLLFLCFHLSRDVVCRLLVVVCVLVGMCWVLCFFSCEVHFRVFVCRVSLCVSLVVWSSLLVVGVLVVVGAFCLLFGVSRFSPR